MRTQDRLESGDEEEIASDASNEVGEKKEKRDARGATEQ